MASDDTLKGQRQRCWDLAFAAFATAFVFQQRQRRFRRRVRFLAFLALGLPVLVGAIALAYGTGSRFLGALLPYAGALSVLQIVASLWSLIADWSGVLRQSSERTWVNHELSSRFAALARTPPDDNSRFYGSLDVLAARDEVNRQIDNQLDITPAELRAGYRAASREFERPCATCHQVARSLAPVSNCPVCGGGGWVWAWRQDWRKLAPTGTLAKAAASGPADSAH